MSVFSSLSSTHSTWAALKIFLNSEEGGHLRIDDHSTPEQPFALIRYVKGKSNMALPHVRAFRSVVWDVLKNVPVSVAPQKSETAESMPTNDNDSTEGYTIERFIDGVMICGFYDNYNKVWRFHTRSTLNANCRFYSQTTSFRLLFEEAVSTTMTWSAFLATLTPGVQYTWVLQHPENRVVVHVATPNITCVQTQSYSGVFLIPVTETTPFDVAKITVPTWSDLAAKLQLENAQFKHNFQGYVIKNAAGNRWKVRGEAYNRVRKIRGNSARRDFLWLSLWRAGTLNDYITLYPEERQKANAIVEKWKQITNTVFHIYTDVFKARSMAKTAIPPKYRPFVFGLHNLYLNELKPQSHAIDWKTVLNYMNTRDTAQALYAINWEVRSQQQQLQIPLEGQVGLEPSVTAEMIVADTSTNPQEVVPRAAAVGIAEAAPAHSVM